MGRTGGSGSRLSRFSWPPPVPPIPPRQLPPFHDVSLRRVADEVKRIARHQRQSRPRSRIVDLDIVRTDDQCAADAIMKESNREQLVPTNVACGDR